MQNAVAELSKLDFGIHFRKTIHQTKKMNMLF